MKLILVRHAERSHEEVESAAPLTNKGKEQAAETKAFYSYDLNPKLGTSVMVVGASAALVITYLLYQQARPRLGIED